MKKLLNTLIVLAIGLGIVYTIALKCKVAHAKPVVKVVVQKEIMSIRELQQALNDKGHSRYKCKVDGKWGGETTQALDNYICDREYKESTYTRTQN